MIPDLLLVHCQADGLAARVAQDELNLIPPEPHSAIEKARRDERGDGAIEFREQRRRDTRVLAVSIIDREGHRMPQRRTIAAQAREQRRQVDELTLAFPEIREQRANGGGLV